MELFWHILIGWGLGCITVALAWGRQSAREEKRAQEIIHTAVSSLGHVMSVCDHWDEVHMQCICGEASLLYKKDDPTGDRLMEQWAENHIESRMESAGR